MTTFLANVRLPSVSGLDEDAVQNSFVIDGAPGWDPVAAKGEVTIPLASFYNAAVHTGLKVSDFIGPSISRTALAASIKLYDISAHLDGSPHGSPVSTDAFTVGGPAPAGELPREVAFAITLRAGNWASQPVERPDGADAGSEVDRPRQRHTGRIYLGPIGENADAMVSGINRPETAFMETCRKAIVHLETQLAVGGHHLAVWSRKDAVARNVDDVQTDNAWDTQRRRGAAPTARLTLALP